MGEGGKQYVSLGFGTSEGVGGRDSEGNRGRGVPEVFCLGHKCERLWDKQRQKTVEGVIEQLFFLMLLTGKLHD